MKWLKEITKEKLSEIIKEKEILAKIRKELNLILDNIPINESEYGAIGITGIIDTIEEITDRIACLEVNQDRIESNI